LDNNESIKVSLIKDFISKSNIKSPFWYQIFYIENISRCTIESYNSMLKFLEEPWKWNIIFMSNASESNIIETIISRVKIININNSSSIEFDNFYYELIDNYTQKKDLSLFIYFFNSKDIEKDEYIKFLETFLYYIKTNHKYIEIIEQIEKSINLISKNNVLPKLEVDKILLEIK